MVRDISRIESGLHLPSECRWEEESLKKPAEHTKQRLLVRDVKFFEVLCPNHRSRAVSTFKLVLASQSTYVLEVVPGRRGGAAGPRCRRSERQSRQSAAVRLLSARHRARRPHRQPRHEPFGAHSPSSRRQLLQHHRMVLVLLCAPRPVLHADLALDGSQEPRPAGPVHLHDVHVRRGLQQLLDRQPLLQIPREWLVQDGPAADQLPWCRWRNAPARRRHHRLLHVALRWQRQDNRIQACKSKSRLIILPSVYSPPPGSKLGSVTNQMY